MGNVDKFDLMARKYDTLEREAVAKVISERIRKEVMNAKEKTAIDFGCGTGLVGLNLLDVFHSVLFLDASQNMVEVVNEKLKELKVDNGSTLWWDEASEYPEGLKADYIILSQVLLHVKNTTMFLSQLYSLLNEGGHLLIVDFDKNESVVSDDIHNGFEQTELIKKLKAIGFKDANSKTFYHGDNLLMNKKASLFILDGLK